MNWGVAKFLEDVLGQVKCKSVHNCLSQELVDHIECLKEVYIEEGLEEALAYEKAIAQMGEPKEVGKALHQAHRPHMEWSVFALIIGILSVGLLTLMYWNKQTLPQEVSSNYLMKQVVYMGIGVVLFIGTYLSDYRYLKKISPSIYGAVVGMLLLTSILGQEVNGSRRWVAIGPINMDVYTVVIPLLMMSYIGILKTWRVEKVKHYVLLGLIGMLPSLFMMKAYFMAGILTGMILTMGLTFHILGKDFKQDKKKFLTLLYSLVGGCGVLGGLFYLRSPYRLKRIMMSYYPEHDPLGVGYQVLRLKEVRNHATLIGDSGFKYILDYIPDPLTDTMFTTVVGCLGWLAGIGLMLMITLMLVRMYQASCRVQESYGRVLSLSITAWFTIQFMYHVGMNLGLLPLSSIGLPFISYGGTSMLMNLFLMGTFLSVYRKKDIVLLDVIR